MKTTLNEIKKHNPCRLGYIKLLKFLEKTGADNEPLEFKTILESNGIRDAIWCLRAVSGHDKEIRLFAVWYARQVEYLDPTGTAKQTNNVSEKFANGEATSDELSSASDAAWAAASYAAWAAAWAAERNAESSASDAAWAAAMAASAAVSDAQEQEFIKRFCTGETNEK